MDNGTIKIATSPVQLSEESSKPRITKRGIAIVLCSWCIYILLNACLQSIQAPFFTSLLWQTLQGLVKLVLSVPIWLIVIRWMDEKRWYWKGLAHLFLGPIYVGLDLGCQHYVAAGFGNKVYAEQLRDNPGWLLFDLFIYIMQFALYHNYEILRKLRVKERITQELLTLQKERELAILRSQINPQFLSGTLHSISEMASTDAEETRTMIAELGDMLRYVIEGSKNDLVPLQKELQFVRDYVDLESKRM